TLLLLVVPLTWTIRDDARLTHTDTRVVALHWVERHVDPNTRIAVDPSLPPFSNIFRVVKLDLPLPSEDHPDPDRDLKRLRLEDVAEQRSQAAEAAFVHEVGRLQPVARRKHAVARGRRAAALHVPEHGHARLEAGALLDLVGQLRADAALRESHVPELVDVAEL